MISIYPTNSAPDIILPRLTTMSRRFFVIITIFLTTFLEYILNEHY